MGSIPGSGDPLEKQMATHCNVLAWEIPGQRNLVGSGPWGCKELNMTERLSNNKAGIRGREGKAGGSVERSVEARLARHLKS